MLVVMIIAKSISSTGQCIVFSFAPVLNVIFDVICFVLLSCFCVVVISTITVIEIPPISRRFAAA